MLTAFVLICSIEVPLEACTRNDATTLLRVPTEFANPATCLMQGQAYLAGSPIGRELDASERVKVICVRTERIVGAPIYRR